MNTASGPAVVTGGYKPNTVAITMSDGTMIPLHGDQVYPSMDHRFGAVVTGTRMKRVVHAIGDVMMPSEHQRSPAADPITLWNFDAVGGAHQIATIHLPSVHLTKAAGQGDFQDVVFSPDNKYVAVLVQGEYATDPRLLGKTFVFATNSGKLVGTAPYGNGMQWSVDSKSLWLGPLVPEGKDRIVNVHGITIWSWVHHQASNNRWHVAG